MKNILCCQSSLIQKSVDHLCLNANFSPNSFCHTNSRHRPDKDKFFDKSFILLLCVFFFLFIPSEPLPMLTTSLTEQQCPWSLPAPSEHGKKIVFLMFFLNDTDISLCVVSVSVCVQYQKMAWRVKQFLMRSGWPISRSWEKPSSRERRTLVRTGNASTS